KKGRRGGGGGGDGCGDGIARHKRPRHEIDKSATGARAEFDGRKRDQREGGVVICGRQPWRKTGSQDRNADASDARRSKDRDAAGSRCAAENLRRGGSGNGFEEGEN